MFNELMITKINEILNKLDIVLNFFKKYVLNKPLLLRIPNHPQPMRFIKEDDPNKPLHSRATYFLELCIDNNLNKFTQKYGAKFVASDLSLILSAFTIDGESSIIKKV